MKKSIKIKQIKFILLIFIVLNLGNTNAQRFVNQACNWPNYSPNGKLRLTSDSTSEDWWFDIKQVPSTHPAYNSGKFITCGYSEFDEKGVTDASGIGLNNYYSNDPCINLTGNDYSEPSGYCNFDLRDMKHLNGVCGTVGLMDITPTSSPSNPNTWIYNYGFGSEFRKVIPTNDGNFLVIGRAAALKTPGPIPPVIGAFVEQQFSLYSNNNIFYQSPNSISQLNAFVYPSCATPTTIEEPGTAIKHSHSCLMKIDKNGKILWYYKYGIEPFLGNGNDAYLNSSIGSDVVEISDGYLFVGALENRSFYGNYGGRSFLAKVNFNGILQWIKTYPNTANTNITSRFLGIKTIKIGMSHYAYVTGESTTDKLLHSGSGYTNSSYNWNGGVSEVFYCSFLSIKMKPFLKKIDLNTGNEIWEVSLENGIGQNHRIRGLEIDNTGKIIIPVLSDCTLNFEEGECKSLKIYKVTDNGSAYSVSSITNLGATRAYDLSVGIAATTDGGFLVTSVKKPYALKLDNDYSNSASGFGNGYNMSSCNNNILSQTDAFVAKCKSTGQIEWTTIFDNKGPGGGGVSPTLSVGNPRNQNTINNWMNNTTGRSKKDIKRQECLFGITTSSDGNIMIAGTMSSNIDDDYIAMIENSCQLDLSNHLIQSIPSIESASIGITNMDNFIASTINTGRKLGNRDEVAEFIVNNNALINITAGQSVDMYEGTDLGFVNPIATPLAIAAADVDVKIDPTHSCTSGPLTHYYVPKGITNGTSGKSINNLQNVNETLVNNDAIIYPNPSTGNLDVKLSISKYCKVSILLVDLNGIVVRTLLDSRELSSRTSILNFNISELPSGIYICKIIIGSFSKQVKLFKK